MPLENLITDLIGIPVAAICPLTDDPRRGQITGATPSPCRRCTREVMVSPAMRRRIRECDQIICTDCAVAIAQERGDKWIDPGRNEDQLTEMAHNGIEPKRFYAKGDQ